MKTKNLTIRIEMALAVACLVVLGGVASLNAAPAGASTLGDPSDADRQAGDNIKNAISHDQWLSFQGRDVKVVPGHGQIVLQGHVASQTEKRYLVSKASHLAGREKIVNQLSANPERTLP
jgi:hypothetical protein